MNKNSLSIEIIEQRLFDIYQDMVILDRSTYVNITTKCKFIHKIFGEKWARPFNILNRTTSFKVKRDISKYTIEDIKNKIFQKHGDTVSLIDSTYVNSHKPCMFIDIEYGEFKATPKDVYLKGVGHRIRGYKNRQINNVKKHGTACMTAFHKLSTGEFVSKISQAKGINPSYGLFYFKKFGEAKFLDFVEAYEKNITHPENEFINLMSPQLILEKFNKAALMYSKYKPDFKLSEDIFINVDGLYWHSQNILCKRRKLINIHDSTNYHLHMRQAFETEDKKIIQFYEDEIYNSPEIVKSIVLNKINIINHKIMARKCIIKKVPNIEAQNFLKNNHLMGTFKSAQSIGLYHNNELITLITYRINKIKKRIDISRFASILNTVVIGGFGKLLKQLEIIAKQNGISTIESFCDLRYADGHSYKQLGFNHVGTTLGWYWTDFKQRFNRLKCKAYKDANGNHVSEAEHAKQLKWHKIYDAGQAKYVKEF